MNNPNNQITIENIIEDALQVEALKLYLNHLEDIELEQSVSCD